MAVINFEKDSIAGEFLRFGAIGAVATLIHYSILISLVELMRAPLVLSTSVGFAAGAIFSYGLNRKITFRHQPNFGSGLTKYVLAGFGGLGFNALLVAGLTRAGLQYMIAQMIATGLVLVWNFTVARIIIFRPEPVKGPTR